MHTLRWNSIISKYCSPNYYNNFSQQSAQDFIKKNKKLLQVEASGCHVVLVPDFIMRTK